MSQSSSNDEQPGRLSYSEVPNNKGLNGGVNRIRELFKLSVTPHYLRRAITNRRLNRHEIGHMLYFSDRDLYDFIVLGTRKSDEPNPAA